MKNLLTFIYSRVQQWLLYLFNLFALRRLQIDVFEVRYETLHNKVRAMVYWDVSGCHRIKIKAYSLNLPGNIKGVSIKLIEDPQLIKVEFNGVFNKLERSVLLDSSSLGQAQQFSVLAPSFSAALNPEQFELHLIDLSCVPLLNYFSAQSLSTSFSEISVTTDISPSPAEFFIATQIEQTYFQ